MPQVKLKEGEPVDVAIRRFKRSCEKAGVLADVRKREFYEKPTQERKRKKAAAVKRYQKKVSILLIYISYHKSIIVPAINLIQGIGHGINIRFFHTALLKQLVH